MKFISRDHMEIVEHRRLWLIIASVVLVLAVLSMAVFGFELDTDFAGGISLQYDLHTALDKAELDSVRSIADSVEGIKVTSVQKSGDDSSCVIIKSADATPEAVRGVQDALNKAYGTENPIEVLSESRISASVSNEIKRSAVIATAIAVVLMLAYITFRFEFRSAIAAVLCLVHDIVIVVASYAVFDIPVSANLIAVMLTILGYSINATIILFDRVRENRKKLGRTDFGTVIDISAGQTLMRSVNTTVTTLFTIGMIYIFGVHSIKEFALPIIVGIVAGFYSSVFLSGTFWYLLSPGKSARI